jgi:tetratricopeptide (TPR) repeat protein
MSIGAQLGQAEALLGARRIPEAIAVLSKVVARRPRESRALHMLGVAHAMTGRTREAEDFLRKAKDEKPQSAQILTDLAALLTQQKRDREALPLLESACKRDPNFQLAQFYCGIALSNLARPAEALKFFDRLAAADPVNTVYQQNRAALLAELERFDEADVIADQILKRHSTMSEALLVKSVAATGRGDLDEAVAICDRIVSRDRNFIKAVFHRGYVNLLAGRLAAGWGDYEARFARDNIAPPLSGVPLWAGEALQGKSILVFAEQGLGDTLMMCRYLPLLVERGAEVLLLVRRSMFRILHGVTDNVQCVDSAPGDRRIDFQIGMMSLPGRFQTELATIPAKSPYLFAEAEKVAEWKQRIGEHGFKVGIAWQGNPNVKMDIGRSLPLSEFLPITQIEGVRLISLQKDAGADQIASSGLQVETPGPDFDGGPDAFVDTAAVMANMDMIITSDTSIPHLAGALRRPVWVALKKVPEWRFMLGRADSPWYPDMKLFRQTTAGDWRAVFEQMATELRQRIP